MQETEDLYRILTPLSGQPECRTCNLCEKNVGLVYLIGDEPSKLAGAGMSVAELGDGSAYLSRSQLDSGASWCSCFVVGTNECGIYAVRPLCCRLYPLDLMNLDGELWWIVHAECPIALRFQND